MADTSLNENRLSLLIWQTSNLWHSKLRFLLKDTNIVFNEYLILETLYNLERKQDFITQQDISKNSSVDKSVVSLKISALESKNYINRLQILDKRAYSLKLTDNGNSLIESLIKIVDEQETIIFNKLGSEIFNFTNSLKLLLGKKIRIKAKLND